MLDVGPEGPDDAPPVDPGVVVELVVLRGDDGDLHRLGDLLGGDDDPRRGLPELADGGAVDGVDGADLGVGLRLLVRQRRRERHEEVGGQRHAGGGRRDDQDGGQADGQPLEERPGPGKTKPGKTGAHGPKAYASACGFPTRAALRDQSPRGVAWFAARPGRGGGPVGGRLRPQPGPKPVRPMAEEDVLAEARRRADGDRPLAAAAGDQRHRRHRPHQSRTGAARPGAAGGGGRGGGGLFEPGVPPRPGDAGLAAGARRGAAGPGLRRRGGAGGQQQRRRRPAGAGRAGPGPGGDRVPG